MAERSDRGTEAVSPAAERLEEADRAVEAQQSSVVSYKAVVSMSDPSAWRAALPDFLEAVPDAMIVVGPDGRVLHVNSQACALFGFTSESLIGSSVNLLIPDRFQDAHGLAIAGFFADPRTRPMGAGGELVGRHQSGREFPLEICLSALPVPDGRLAIAAIRDVTERKDAQEALRASEEQFRKIFEEGPIGIAVLDLDFCFLHVNQRFCDMLGYSAEELRARTFPNITHPDDVAADVDLAVRLLRGEIPRYTMEKRYIRKNGDVIWIALFASVLHDADNRPLYGLAMVEDITSRKEIEEALRSSEERYRTLVEQAADGIFTADQSGRYTDVNPNGCRMLGYSRDEVLARSITDVVAPEEVPRVQPQLEEMKNGSRHLGEWLFLRKDGTTFPGEVSGGILADGRVVGILRDISERKHVENALRESEERFRAAIEAMHEGFVMQDRDGRIVICNKSAEQILGVTADQMMGKTSFDPRWKSIREDGSEFPAAQRPIHRSLTEGAEMTDVIIGVQRAGGDIVWLSTNSAPVGSPDHPSAAIATFIDITAKRVADSALRESEERFRMLADSAPVLIWMTDEKGQCSYLNRRWTEFTGREVETGLGKGWAEDIHPEDRDRVMREVDGSIPARSPVLREFRLRRQDGQYRTIVDSGVPRISREGTFLGFIGSGVDVTEQKELQQQLFEAQKLESLGRLAGGLAHDFNNLLTAITGYTELARMEAVPDSPEEKYLSNVLTAADRAATLTRQLLMYARRQMVEFTPIDLNRVIRGLDSLLRRTIGETYELTLSLSEGLWSASTNASQMEQVLMNLVVNARDSMPTGGRILITTGNVVLDDTYAKVHPDVVPGEYVMFSVSDNGPGMTSEVKKRIFEPFFTTKEMGHGTGLGMAICYGIVKQSRGNIEVLSEPGAGTAFKVYLPRVEDAPDDEPVAPSHPSPGGTETILLVDDDPMVRDIATEMLRARGYRVLEASNGADALHIQNEYREPIDLLVTDVVMPVMGGKELADRLLLARPEIRILFMSGYTQNEIVRQGVLAPDVALLTKPFTSSELTSRVHAILHPDVAAAGEL